jgi:hypothetical protein
MPRVSIDTSVSGAREGKHSYKLGKLFPNTQYRVNTARLTNVETLHVTSLQGFQASQIA